MSDAMVEWVDDLDAFGYSLCLMRVDRPGECAHAVDIGVRAGYRHCLSPPAHAGVITGRPSCGFHAWVEHEFLAARRTHLPPIHWRAS